MTSRERFFKVFNGEIPDRVPITLFIADQGHFISQIYPDIDPFDYPTLQKKVIEIQKQLGCDVFVRMLYDVNDPLLIHTGGLNVEQQTDSWEVKTTIKKNGNTTIKCSEISTPKGKLYQEYSINELRPGTYMYACTLKPIKTEKDLDIAIEFEPQMPETFKTSTKQKVQAIKEAVGEDGIVGVWAPHGPFNNASLLIDLDELYMLYLTDFDFYHKLMTFASTRILPYTRAIEQSGADVLCVGGNVAGGFLGKANYDQYILPYEKKYVDFCQINNTPVIYHNCGEIMNLIDSYKELGAKIIEPFSPYPLGDADLKKAKKIVNGSYVMIGGVDQVNVLQKGDISLVKKVTKQTILDGKTNGKFILQSADFLEYGTPIENLLAYVQTAKEFAYY